MLSVAHNFRDGGWYLTGGPTLRYAILQLASAAFGSVLQVQQDQGLITTSGEQIAPVCAAR